MTFALIGAPLRIWGLECESQRWKPSLTGTRGRLVA